MTTKYYHDPEADELVIASFDADGALSEVRRLTQSVEFEDETEEETEEEPEIVPEKKKPVVTPAVSKKSNKGIGRGKRASFDIEAMRSDIKDGMKTAVIADKYGVTLQTVYNTKSKMKAQQSGLSESEIEEIQQLRADGLTSSEIAADLGIEIKQVEAVQAKPYLAGKGLIYRSNAKT